MAEAEPTLTAGAFKHIVVPIGVVIGLGLARIVMTLSQYAAQRERVRFSAVHGLWSVMLFVMFIGLWWILWGLSHAPAERWTFFVLLYLIAGPILIYLPSILLMPDLPDQGSLDLGELFDGLARTVLLFMAGFIVWLAGAELYLLGEPFATGKRLNQGVVCGAFLVGAAFPSRRVAGIVGAVSLAVVLFALATLRARLG